MPHDYPSYPPLDPANLHLEVDVHPRQLAPLSLAPLPLHLPPLPSPLRNPNFTSSYTLTTHLFPSAYPHAPSSAFPPSSYADISGETKEERIKRQKALVYDLWSQNRAQVKGEIPEPRGEPEVLWNAVNRFVNKDAGKQQKGVTLFLAHANGFPKEIWEPTLLEILSRIEPAHVIIDEIWAFEAVQHGDSALVNENVIGNIFDWADNARDILHLLLYYLPSSASPAPLPTHLFRLPEDVGAQRKAGGYKDRTFVGIGHSLGGCSMNVFAATRAAIAYPALFASLILIDPVIVPRWAVEEHPTGPAALASTAIHRRTKWNSRDEALALFRKSPFFSAWDPAVLGEYVEHGLAPDHGAGTKGAVRLKMSGTQEAIVFIDKRLSHEVWQLLPQLDERIEIRFILSGTDTFALGGDRAARELVWRARNASNVLIPSAGHLIPQEVPQTLANLVVEFLERKHGTLQGAKSML